eukprot:3415242-Amphidinium_carterae.1
MHCMSLHTTGYLNSDYHCVHFKRKCVDMKCALSAFGDFSELDCEQSIPLPSREQVCKEFSCPMRASETLWSKVDGFTCFAPSCMVSDFHYLAAVEVVATSCNLYQTLFPV